MKIQWNDFELYTKKLLEKIKKDKYYPDIIIAVGVSGFIPAVIVAKELQINNIQTIIIKSYNSDNKKLSPEIISENISSLHNKKILVVDDIIATGETFNLVKKRLLLLEPKEVRFAVPVVSEYVCREYPEYWGESILRSPDDFITLPWDK